MASSNERLNVTLPPQSGNSVQSRSNWSSLRGFVNNLFQAEQRRQPDLEANLSDDDEIVRAPSFASPSSSSSSATASHLTSISNDDADFYVSEAKM